MGSPMMTWRNRPVDGLSATELRIALDDAVRELMHTQKEASSDLVFRTLVLGYIAGALTAGLALLLVFALR